MNEVLQGNKLTAEFPNEFHYENRILTDSTEIANCFNEYFANIWRKLSEKIDPPINTNDNYQSYLTESTNAQFKFNYVSEKEVLKIIDSLKNKASYGTDEISNKLLRSIKNEICKPLTLIINQSLTIGIFPNAFKTSKVKPIYKKGDIADLNNYRPISLLPTISKVFERVIHTQIVSYLCTNNLLCEQQYGFRAKYSTELASIKLVDFLTQNMDVIRYLPLCVLISQKPLIRYLLRYS